MARPNVEIKWTSDDRKVIDGLNRQNVKLQEAVDNLKKVNREGKKADGALDGMVGTLTRMVGPAAVLAGISSALAQAEAHATAASAAITSMEAPLKNLVQQAGGDPAQLAQFNRLAKTISAATGVPQGLALAGVQKGLALGLSPQDISGIFATKSFEQNPLDLVFGIGRQRQLFGQEIAHLSSRDLVNALLQAQTPTEVGASTLSTLALQPAGLTKTLGGTLQEALGFTAFASTAAATPEIGVTQGSAFLTKLITDPKQRFAGKGVLGGIETFRGLSEAQQRKIIGGRKEALLFESRIKGGQLTEAEQVAVISKQQGLEQFAGQVQKAGFREIIRQTANIGVAIGRTGTPQGLVTKETRAALGDPVIASIVAEQRANERLQISREASGVFEKAQDATIAIIKSRIPDAGGGPLLEAFAAYQLWVADVLGRPPEYLAKLGAGQIVAARGGGLGILGRQEEQESILAELPRVLEGNSAELRGLRQDNKEILEETRGSLRLSEEVEE